MPASQPPFSSFSFSSVLRTLILQSVPGCRLILHFISRGWAQDSRGEQAILLDVTLTLSLSLSSCEPSILRFGHLLPFLYRPSLFSLIFTRCDPLFLVSSHSDREREREREGLQMAAISACIDSWNWEDLLVSGLVPSIGNQTLPSLFRCSSTSPIPFLRFFLLYTHPPRCRKRGFSPLCSVFFRSNARG